MAPPQRAGVNPPGPESGGFDRPGPIQPSRQWLTKLAGAATGAWARRSSLLDVFWPTLEQWSPERVRLEEERAGERLQADLARVRALASREEEELETYAEEVGRAYEAERERGQSVESRLTSILGLASVAASAVLGLLTFHLGRSTNSHPTFGNVVAFLLTLYIVLQVLRAVLAAVTGLSRRSYRKLVLEERLPDTEEDRKTHLIRLMETEVKRTHQMDEVVNAKVDQMALAHDSLRNFLWGVAVLAVFLTSRGLLPGTEEPVERRVLRALRADPEMIELLRGHRGAPGPPGPSGPPGPRGNAGPPSPRVNSAPGEGPG